MDASFLEDGGAGMWPSMWPSKTTNSDAYHATGVLVNLPQFSIDVVSRAKSTFVHFTST